MTKKLFHIVAVGAMMIVGAGFFISNMALAGGGVYEYVSGDTAAGENQSGWLFNRDLSTSTPFEFNTDAASIGSGSLYVLPITNSNNGNADKFIAEYFLLTPIAEVMGIDYDFQIGTGGEATDEHHFYMNVYTNFGESDDLNYYDCKYDVVPTVGVVGSFTTVSFNPTQDYPVTTRLTSPHTCPSTPAHMESMSPGATIRMFALNVGDTSANDLGLDGYLDNVIVDTLAGVTTFDFDPNMAREKTDCKNDGWMAFGFKNQGQCVRYVETAKDSR